MLGNYFFPRAFSVFLFLIPICCHGEIITWHVPPDISDGYYTVSLNGSNTQFPIIEYLGAEVLGDFTESKSPDRPQHHTLSPRDKSIPVSKKGCRGSRPLDPADHYATKEALRQWCDNGWVVERQMLMVGVKNTVIYWVCNHKKMSYHFNDCSSKQLIEAEKIFNETCGEDKGAFVEMKKWKKTYGRAAKGDGGPITCGPW